MTAALVLDDATYLDTAFALGARLCRNAIEHDGRCTWITPVATLDRSQPISASCGPDLHGGTAGIALFLAALAQATGERFIAQGATAAMRHALASSERFAAAAPLGLYGGAPGIAFAAIHMGGLLDRAEFVESALQLLARLPISAGPRDTDLVSGIAGSLLALLAGYRASSDVRLLDAARACAIELETRAVHEDDTASWVTMTEIVHNLTGFAHGTAGIAYALCALHAVAPDARVRALATGAIAYEQRVFDSAAVNWPDFRTLARSAQGTFPGSMAWCHGAPGIALSRDIAHTVLGDESYAEQARLARTTTARAIGVALADASVDYTPCHGLTGLAGILAADPSSNTHWNDLVTAVASNGVQRHHREERPWSCGVPARGEAPGLMTGLAGIGYFYLRRARPQLPDILAVAS